jgi:hypothetical protein
MPPPRSRDEAVIREFLDKLDGMPMQIAEITRAMRRLSRSIPDVHKRYAVAVKSIEDPGDFFKSSVRVKQAVFTILS